MAGNPFVVQDRRKQAGFTLSNFKISARVGQMHASFNASTFDLQFSFQESSAYRNSQKYHVGDMNVNFKFPVTGKSKLCLPAWCFVENY